MRRRDEMLMLRIYDTGFHIDIISPHTEPINCLHLMHLVVKETANSFEKILCS